MRLWCWSRMAAALVCAWPLLAHAEPAHAEPSRAERSAATTAALGRAAAGLEGKARSSFETGVAAFERGDFEAARIAFLQAYALKPEVAVVRRNLGLSEIYGGHHLDGARRLARLLHTTPDGSVEERARILESLKLAEAHLERVTVEVDRPGAQIHIDGVSLGASPLPLAWYVPPGLYQVRVELPGFVPHTESRLARAGGAQHVRIVLRPSVAEPAAAPQPAPTPRPAAAPAPIVHLDAPTAEHGPNPWLLLAGGALSAGALAAGAVFSISAAGNEDRAQQLRTDLRGFSCKPPGVSGCEELQRATRQHDRDVRWALGSFIGAGVTGAATLLYGLLAGGAPEPVEGQGQQRPGWQLHATWRRGPHAVWSAAF